MELALYDPAEGFYMSGEKKGVGADFVTSSEASPLFGYSIAAHVLDKWAKASSPPNLWIIEVGGGNGRLLSHIGHIFGYSIERHGYYPLAHSELIDKVRQALRLEIPRNPPALYYTIIDPAARKHQLTKNSVVPKTCTRIEDLAPLASCMFVESFDAIERLEQKSISLNIGECFIMVVANEVFDNIPSHLVFRDGETVNEILVGESQDRLVFVSGLAPPNLQITERSGRWRSVFSLPAELIDRFHPSLASCLDKTAEIGIVSPQQEMLMTRMCNLASRSGCGAVLVFDLFDNPCRSPVVAYARHGQIFDPLTSPGDTDVMVPVLWESLVATLLRLGFDPEPMKSQRQWLTDRGIGNVVNVLATRAAEEQLDRGEPIRTFLARSLVVSARALCDPAGLGGFAALEATLQARSSHS